VGLIWSPESKYAQELAKWEQRPTAIVPAEMLTALGKPLSPAHQEYPKALYRAVAATGGPTIRGFIVAETDRDEARLLNLGWSLSQEAALEKIHAQERDIAQAAAERAFAERRMGERAREEAAAVDASTPAHVPVIPDTPIRKRQPYVRRVKESS
jgi:hypothetical protein